MWGICYVVDLLSVGSECVGYICMFYGMQCIQCHTGSQSDDLILLIALAKDCIGGSMH